VFEQAADQLAAIIHAVHDQLHVPPDTTIPVSYSGGVFKLTDLVTSLLEAALRQGERRYRFVAPRLPPVAGAALYAAKLAGFPLSISSIERLESHSVVKDPA
jgi:hypothetical protein